MTPTNASIPVGQRQQFTATGTYSDGSKKDLTSSATWTSSAPSVATISGGGLATAIAAGSTSIKATSGSVSGSTGLTVTAQTQHSVVLSWTASVSPLIGYNIYRSNTSGGPYSKLNSTLNSSTTFTDTSVLSGYTYYYVTTAVDAQLNESVYSNEAFAAVP